MLVLSIGVFSQDDWSKLSAKQKLKIAKKEQKAAKKDPEYLKLMAEALHLFQTGNYNEARVKYQLAHERRPDNVYPTVMLDDIEVAMNLVQEEVKEEIIAETIPEVIEEEQPSVQFEEEKEAFIESAIENKEEESISIVENDSEIELPVEPEKIKVIEKPKQSPEKKITRVQVQEEYLNDGVYRDSFKEGNADVEQVKIVEKGVETIYKKVKHPWGAIYYFKGEDSISKKEWEDILKAINED
jgi:uncharacterized membrane-anchored protein YjiN (DUF445 family)